MKKEELDKKMGFKGLGSDNANIWCHSDATFDELVATTQKHDIRFRDVTFYITANLDDTLLGDYLLKAMGFDLSTFLDKSFESLDGMSLTAAQKQAENFFFKMNSNRGPEPGSSPQSDSDSENESENNYTPKSALTDGTIYRLRTMSGDDIYCSMDKICGMDQIKPMPMPSLVKPYASDPLEEEEPVITFW